MTNGSDPQPQQLVYTDEYGNPLDSQQPIYPSGEQQDENIIRYQLDTFNEITRLSRLFRGEMWNPDKNAWEKKSKPMMNEEGITKVTSFVIFGKNKLLSNYDRKILSRTLLSLLNVLSRQIYNNNDKWKIEDTATADAIMDIIFDHLQSIFLAAESGDMRIYFQKQIREQHTYVQSPKPEKQRFWQRF